MPADRHHRSATTDRSNPIVSSSDDKPISALSVPQHREPESVNGLRVVRSLEREERHVFSTRLQSAIMEDNSSRGELCLSLSFSLSPSLFSLSLPSSHSLFPSFGVPSPQFDQTMELGRRWMRGDVGVHPTLRRRDQGHLVRISILSPFLLHSSTHTFPPPSPW